jgi:aryl-alcohol dehydrogenase-like predicted oxidoreductase
MHPIKRYRLYLNVVALIGGLTFCRQSGECFGFCWTLKGSTNIFVRRRSRCKTLCNSKRSAEQPKEDVADSNQSAVISSNFWYTVVRKDAPQSTARRQDNVDSIVLPSLRRDAVQHHGIQKLPPLPCVPTLDSDGPLPPEMYVQLTPDAKPTNRIQVAWDVSESRNTNVELSTEDIADMVSVMQNAIDHGLTTFHLKSRPATLSSRSPTSLREKRQWTETFLYGSLIRDTPATVLQQCQLVVPLYLSDVMEHESMWQQSQTVSLRTVRSAIVQRLGSMKSESIDNVQIQFPAHTRYNRQSESERPPKIDASLYYLDLLDALQDIQREGLVASISACSMPDWLLHQANSVGLSRLIETNQVDGNLLNPKRLSTSSLYPAGKQSVVPWTVVSNVLASGWLTDRYAKELNGKRPPPPATWFQSLSTPERASWQSNVAASTWGKAFSDDTLRWKGFQQQVLPVLVEIARKHRVSVAAVALRWTLQQGLGNVASVAVACRLWPDHVYDWEEQQRHHGESRTQRPKQLRDVLKFALDDEDLALLCEISQVGDTDPEHSTVKDPFYDENGLMEDGTMTTRNGLLIPMGGGKYY